MTASAYSRTPPKACKDSQDEYSPAVFYCLRSLILPKKSECKLRRKIEHKEEQ